MKRARARRRPSEMLSKEYEDAIEEAKKEEEDGEEEEVEERKKEWNGIKLLAMKSVPLGGLTSTYNVGSHFL